MKNWRLHIILFLFIIATGIIIWQLYGLQIKQGEYYEALALGQQVSFQETSGKRGEIFLKNGEMSLAQTKDKIIAYIFPNKIPGNELARQAEILAELLVEDEAELLLFFREGQILKREISENTLKLLQQKELKGIFTDQLLGRFYPQQNLASHIIGFVNEAGEGQYGIEGYYNNILKGPVVFQEKGRSPLGYLALFLGSENEQLLEQGASLYLTLDYNIQYFAEKLLKEAKEEWDIDSGQIIIQDPQTGKILALAHFPSFNPNQYASEQGLEAFLNSATQKLFEPGSVFKPFTMASALEEELITPETEYEDKGFVKVGGPPIYNFGKRVWGKQTMTDVLEESINTGAVFVEQELGAELFWRHLEQFGFFEKTDIDLQGETFSLNETLKNGYPRDFAVASFGQGIEISPIQLVRAFAALANGGKLLRPYLVEKIVKSNGEEILTPVQVQGLAISERTALQLTSMLIKVVEQGSARRAKIDGYFIAGKTGTAQVSLSTGGYSEEKTVQSFAGYFPAFSPKILIFIKLDNPKEVITAGYCAAPLFKKLAKYIIDLKQIPPDYD